MINSIERERQSNYLNNRDDVNPRQYKRTRVNGKENASNTSLCVLVFYCEYTVKQAAT